MNEYLNNAQKKIVKDNSKYLLVCAPAGSGKTFTILEKVNYLVKKRNIKENKILCISFTNKAVNNMKNKLKSVYNLDINCLTFHKLGLEVLKKYNYKVCEYKLLSYIINEYFESLIFQIDKHLAIIKKHFNVRQYKHIHSSDLNNLKLLIERFITIFKSNNKSRKDFYYFYKNEKNSTYKNLLIITFYIYNLYQLELTARNEIDFNDMISLATEKIKKDGFYNTDYIIIDEFQDTSLVRFQLIKEILNKTKASLLVVGDDYQSIYQFAGCDLNIFLNFKNIFNNSNILTLNQTYRNSKEIVNITNNFITKNKNQIKKNIIALKSIKDSVTIIYYLNIKKAFKKLIEEIYSFTKQQILVLARNNKDIYLVLDSSFILENDKLIYKKNKDIEIRFLTIHKSKGLEDENVIVINLINNINGFPNKIENNSILKYVTLKSDKYPYSEERRIMYVALTRTKNKVFLLSPVFNRSIFIKELEKYKQIKKRFLL